MQASVRVVIEGDEKTVEFEAESMEHAHACAVFSTHSGALQGVMLRKIINGDDMSMTETLDQAYSQLGGQTVPYTVCVDGIEEHGIVDISPSALGEHYYNTMDEASKERFRYHVQGQGRCRSGERCPVLQLAQAFGIDHHFRAADH